MRIGSVIDVIETMAPPSGQASWDKSGLQVACHRDEVTKLAVALDPTPDTVSRALSQGADLILTHHPLSLAPELPSRHNHYFETLSLLFRQDVALYAAHTSLDVQADGPAGWLARTLELLHPEILEPTGENIGFGLAGDLPKALSFRQLCKILGRSISLATATVSGTIPDTIRRIAYCTGSGSSLLPEVEQSGADIYITGDIKYHTALDTQVCLLDVGHHSLEEEMMHIASGILARRLPDLEVFFVASSSPMRRALES